MFAKRISAFGKAKERKIIGLESKVEEILEKVVILSKQHKEPPKAEV